MHHIGRHTHPQSHCAGVTGLVSGTASQSSEGWSGAPSRAIDGNTAQSYRSSSCTHTRNTGNPWWKLTMAAEQAIAKVEVWNRADCCRSRLNGVQVKIGSHLCGTLSGSTSVQTMSCGNKRGTVVEFKMPRSDYLTLCEVKVYAAKGDK